MADLLITAREGMHGGALALDRDVMERLGCFNQRVNGAGTVAAGAAVFLMSRYAVAPGGGVLESAFARGADTDTIASMTGALLGALLGAQALTDLDTNVQDGSALAEAGASTARLRSWPPGGYPLVASGYLSPKALEEFRSHVFRLNTNEEVRLPDDRVARVLQQEMLPPTSAARLPGERS